VGPAAARVRGFQIDAVTHAAKHRDAVNIDVPEAAGRVAANGDCRDGLANNGIAHHHVFRGAVDAQAIGVHAGLEADGIVIVCDVDVFHEYMAGRVDVHAVGAWTERAIRPIVADGKAVYGDVAGVADVNRPERRAPEHEAADDANRA